MLNKLFSFLNPERYQGWSQKRKYFEGWYYKIVDQGEESAFAIIPGVAISENKEKHAFIQILDGKKRTASYLRFPFDSFNASSNSFSVSIGKNRFSESEVYLDLDDYQADLKFAGNVSWPKPFYSPGIMGPYSFVPFMECKHGIVSMDHGITGTFSIHGRTIDFTNGRGYIEKDWGRSFPSAYVWMQSNHFENPCSSFKISVAKIPWIGSSFVGFIAGLWFENQLFRFTTYNKTSLNKCKINKDSVEIELTNNSYRLRAQAQKDYATELASPISGIMDGRIEESMTSQVEVELIERRTNKEIFHQTGRNVGLEVAGKIEEIIT